MGLIKSLLLGAVMPGGTKGTGTAKGSSFLQKLGQSAKHQAKQKFNPLERLKTKYGQFQPETEEEKRKKTFG